MTKEMRKKEKGTINKTYLDKKMTFSHITISCSPKKTHIINTGDKNDVKQIDKIIVFQSNTNDIPSFVSWTDIKVIQAGGGGE